MIDYSKRHFQMWRYEVGHSQLLLRSPKAVGFSTRIDVLFKDVGAFHLPTTMHGLSIFEANEQEQAELHVQIGRPSLEERKVFIVRGSNFTGYVIAGVVASHEDECEYYEPSHFASLQGDER
jgi:hypothetical protein